MEKHVRILGILFIVWGAMLLLIVLLTPFVPGLIREEARAALNWIAVAFTAVIAAFYMFAGWSLLTLQSWARATAIAASVLALFNFPIGTALGVYGLWVTMSEEGRRLFTSYKPAGSA